ncbi:MAG: nuclear transport factor 2 family protein [Deltaproteobacteria bacterium]|nr:nuclear transport factor 2 family protein [Deltaproteobacteria bacterium]
MTTREIADHLVALCRARKYREAILELYAPDATQSENGQSISGGRDALVAACKGWEESRIVHGTEILGVHVGPDSVVVEMRHDVTPHATKQRNQWSEAAVYRVRDGKITDVRFYYKPAAA